VDVSLHHWTRNKRKGLMEFILTAVVLPFQVALLATAGWMVAMICLLPIIALRDIIHTKLDGSKKIAKRT